MRLDVVVVMWLVMVWLIIVGNYNLWLNVVGCGCGDVVHYGCG